MTLMSEFLATVAASDICRSYYALCHEHPLRPEMAKENAAAKQVLDAAAGLVPLEKLRGPGSAYRLLSLPNGISLNFIIQGRSAIETDFTVPFSGTCQRGTFAILCNAASTINGGPAPRPPYPRPTFHSLDELIAIFRQFDGLVRRLGNVRAGELGL